MIRPKIVIRKKNAIVEVSTPANSEKALKGLKKPGVHPKLLSTNKPLLQKAYGWTDKSPRERLHLRTCELASFEGRSSHEITQGNYEQAKREVTGEKILTRQNAVLNAVIEV